MRRGDRTDGSRRRAARHAEPAPPLPRREGTLRLPDAREQRRDPGGRALDHRSRRRGLREDGHREEQGHEGLRPGRKDQIRRHDRGSHGHQAARDHLRRGRRHPADPLPRRGGQGDRQPARFTGSGQGGAADQRGEEPGRQPGRGERPVADRGTDPDGHASP